MTSDQERAAEDRKVDDLVEYIRNLGLESLSKEISEERFARRILDSQLWINSYEFEKSIEEERQSNIEQRLIALQSQMFDKAANYNNIVISFGYAGFFAIWNFVSDEMHLWDTALIALLLGSSLLVFVFWTLVISYHNSKYSRDLAGVYSLDFDNTEEKVAAILAKEHELSVSALWLQKVWFYVFIFTIFTGFSAGVMLILLMFCRVLNFDFDLFDAWSLINQN